MSEFRPHQYDAVCSLAAGIKAGHRAQILCAPCGFGKSYVASRLLKRSVEKTGRPAYFNVDRTVLIDQVYDDLVSIGADVGVMQGDNPLYNPYAPIQLCTIQTLTSRGKRSYNQWPISAGLIMIDEVHIFHQKYIEMMAACKDAAIIGLSATPLTKGLGNHFTNLVVGSTPRYLIDNGYLVDVVAYSPQAPDLSDVKIVRGDFAKGQTSQKMQQLVGNLGKSYIKYGQMKKFMLYAVDIAHSKASADAFNSAGIPVAHLDGHMDREERSKIMRDFRANKYLGLTSVGCLSYGVDVPDVEVIILASPTKSEMKHQQVAGRVMRTAKGKTEGIIIDLAGNMQRGFSYPSDFTVTSISNSVRKITKQEKDKDKKADEIVCPDCDIVLIRGRCSKCGYEVKRKSNVVYLDRNLRKITGKNKKDNKNWVTASEKRKWYGMFMTYADQKKYDPGWAYHAYVDKYKENPPTYGREKAQITEEFTRWITYRNIRQRYSR